MMHIVDSPIQKIILSPISAKFINLSLYSFNLVFCFTFFASPYFLTLMHLCIMLYTYWTPLPLSLSPTLSISHPSSFLLSLSLSTSAYIISPIFMFRVHVGLYSSMSARLSICHITALVNHNYYGDDDDDVMIKIVLAVVVFGDDDRLCLLHHCVFVVVVAVNLLILLLRRLVLTRISSSPTFQIIDPTPYRSGNIPANVSAGHLIMHLSFIYTCLCIFVCLCIYGCIGIYGCL